MPNEGHVGVLLAMSMAMSACSWLMAVVVAVVVALVAATTTSAFVAVVGAFVGWVSTTWLPEGFFFREHHSPDRRDAAPAALGTMGDTPHSSSA